MMKMGLGATLMANIKHKALQIYMRNQILKGWILTCTWRYWSDLWLSGHLWYCRQTFRLIEVKRCIQPSFLKINNMIVSTMSYVGRTVQKLLLCGISVYRTLHISQNEHSWSVFFFFFLHFAQEHTINLKKSKQQLIRELPLSNCKDCVKRIKS